MSIIVFIRYKKSVKKNFAVNLFRDGKILWAGHDGVPFSTISEAWDEVFIIKYPSEKEEKIVINRIAEENDIVKCKVLSLNLISPANLEKLNNMLKSYSKTSIDMTQTDIREKANEANADPSFKHLDRLMEKDKNQAVCIVNLIKVRDLAVFADDYKGRRVKKGKPLTGSEVYEKYTSKFMQICGIFGAQFVTVGRVKTVLYGDEDSDWKTFTVVQYPSLNTLLEILSLNEIDLAFANRNAGLEKTKVTITNPYEEYLIQ